MYSPPLVLSALSLVSSGQLSLGMSVSSSETDSNYQLTISPRRVKFTTETCMNNEDIDMACHHIKITFRISNIPSTVSKYPFWINLVVFSSMLEVGEEDPNIQSLSSDSTKLSSALPG